MLGECCLPLGTGDDACSVKGSRFFRGPFCVLTELEIIGISSSFKTETRLSWKHPVLSTQARSAFVSIDEGRTESCGYSLRASVSLVFGGFGMVWCSKREELVSCLEGCLWFSAPNVGNFSRVWRV